MSPLCHTGLVDDRMETLATATGQFLVLPIFLGHDLLCLGQQRLGRVRIRMGKRPVAQFVVGVRLERDCRSW